ncbi:MAG: hypothetical protein F7C81_01450 [Desulfurococcales archaeon]|nr:hypothetical protein [Desulfurococcales archaeon]
MLFTPAKAYKLPPLTRRVDDPGFPIPAPRVYALPELRYLGVMESRLWETSQVMATTWVYYKRVEALDYTEGRRPSKVIVARGPRLQAPSWRGLLKTHPLSWTK